MIIKLPVIVNNKLIYELFTIIINKKHIILDVFKKVDNIYQIYLYNKDFCLTKLNIIFPFKFKVVDKEKMIYSNLFFFNAIFNSKNDIDFFYCFIKLFNNIFKTEYKYVSLDYIRKNRELFYKIDDIKTNFKNFNEFKYYVNNKLSQSLNIFYSILYFYSKNIKSKNINKVFKLCKELIEPFQYFINIKISLLSSHQYPIKTHLTNINSKNFICKEHKTNIKYFIKNNNSNIYNFVATNKNNNILSNNIKKINTNIETLYIYNINYINKLNIEYFIKYLMNNDTYLKFLLAETIFKYDKIYINNILNFIYYDNSNYLDLLLLKKLSITFDNFEYNNIFVDQDYLILKNNIYNYNFITALFNKYKDNKNIKIEILKILISNYNYPISYNNKKISKEFEILMYFSLLIYKDIITVNNNKIFINNDISLIIPFKLKDLFSNLIKIYYQYINNSIENITYNYKFYQKQIFIKIIKNILENNTILTNLFNNQQLNTKLKQVFSNNFIIYNIIPQINWKNLGKKLHYLNFIINNKDVIIFNNTFNKNLFPDNYDHKIKNIIINPLLMYKYLKTEKDFVKWTMFLKNNIFSIFDIPISINDNDLHNIGILLYKINTLTIQDINDNLYKELISFCQKHKKLIIYQDKININFRNKLYNITKIKINLGILLKHITYTDQNEIQLSNNIEIELKKTKKKYYKYKGKYLKIKSETETNNN